MTSRSHIEPRWTRHDYETRPRRPDPLVVEMILDRLRNGEMLSSICADDPDLPLPGTFLSWVADDSGLESEYLAARRIGTEVSFDAVVEEAHSGRGDAATRANSLKFYAERMNPDKFGPRSTVRQGAPADDPGGGVDYSSAAAEVRRRIDAMAARRAKERDGEAKPAGG